MNASIENIYGLSPLQAGLLFHSLSGSTEVRPYVVQLVDEFVGDFDDRAFDNAWHRLARRHSALRTSFVWEGVDEPLQVVRRDARIPIAHRDWRGHDDQDARLDALLAEDRAAGFDLTAAPLLRFTVVRTAQDRRIVLWTFHHLLLDGWSVQLVQREFRALYQAEHDGRSLALPEPGQYVDYIAWLRGQPPAEREAFWRAQFQDFESVTDFVGAAGGAGGPAGFGEADAEWGVELTSRLNDFAKANKITVNTVVQGVWALLLSRYTGSDDVVHGTTVAGRPAELPHAQSTVGLFINTLPARTRLDPDRPVRDWLADVQAQHADLRDFAGSSLVDIHGWSGVPRATALFQSIVMFENYPKLVERGDSLPGTTWNRLVGVERGDYPITLLAHSGEQFSIRFVYDTSLFDPGTVDRMLGHFLTISEAVVRAPDTPVGELPMLTEQETRQLLVQWNDTAAPYPADRCVHELITEQTLRQPDRTALVFDDVRLSYRELEERSNQTAHWLTAAGVGPGVLVGVFMEPGVELVVGLLGVLKAGGAYVPLDPDHPRDRLEFMLADTAAAVVLTQKSLADLVPAGPDRQVLYADGDADPHPSTNPGRRATPGDLAYVIYTSGSTGRPKGVQIEHRSLVNYLVGADHDFPAGGGERVLLHSSITFDLTATPLFLTLMRGHELVVSPPWDQEHVEEAARAVFDGSRYALLKATPAHLELLLSVAEPGAEIQVGTVVIGGEPLSTRLARAVLAACSDGTVIINEYGHTETTVACVIQAATRSTPLTGAEVPVGRPMANTYQYLLDPAGRLVPVGVVGELYTGGDGVARGYLNRPELNAARFAERVIGGEPRRVYRSGDLLRRRADGVLEFCGRTDDQIKFRGFRIELGEIEAALCACPPIAEAVVMARTDSPGDQRLVGYVVATDPAAGVDVPAVRALLRDRLPEYMVPTVLVTIDAIPLTRNGKVDKKALPAPDGARPDLADAYVAPAGPVQTAIAAVWAQVLGVDRIGADDDFFELGGHSLLATRVVSRLRRELGVDLAIRAVFTAPTVARLAALLTAAGTGAGPAPAVTAVPRGSALPLSFAQQRLWFLDQLEPGSSQYLVPVTLRLHGDLDPAALAHALTALVHRHESLRTTFDQLDGAPVQLVHDTVPFALQVRDLPEVPGAVTAAALAPMDLRRGPLIRAVLHRCGPDEHLLVLTLHHIVADGWSFGVFARELAELYAAHRAGRDADLPALAVQYPDFAVWQRGWLRDDVLDEQLNYWTRQLTGLAPVELPTDRPRPAVQTGHGAALTCTVPTELSDRLRALFQRHAITPFMGFLAVFDILLSRYTGSTDLAVGTPVAGRNRAEIEDLIGFFVNTLVLRTDLSDDPTVAQLWQRTREQSLDAFAHQDLPFERLVDHLAPDRDLSRTPLFQHLFVLQNAMGTDWALPGLRIEAEALDSIIAKFDLTLEVEESADGFGAAFVYRTDLFDEATIRRMAGHFLTLLDAVAADPDAPVSSLPMLTGPETDQLLVQGNDTEVSWPTADCVHELIARQAARTPDATAVTAGDQLLTYRELDARANRIAHWLIDAGVGPDTPVGICLHRGIDTVAAALGVLKAGGAYVPLAPEHPHARLDHILTDTAAPVVLTQCSLADRFPDRRLCHLDGTDLDDRPSTDPGPRATPGDLAYILHTSGSTGVPKGVQVEHRALSNLLHAMQDVLHTTAGDRLLAVTTTTFDIATLELLQPLVHGAHVRIASNDEVHSPDTLATILTDGGITVFQSTPSLWRTVLDALGDRPVPLRLLLGGEALDPGLAAATRPLVQRLTNVYGPTETTIWSLSAELTGDDQGVPIGRPLANTEVFVLDAADRPVPLGVVGELYIGGTGLARGYHNRPELTAERFVHKEIGGRTRRLYRTGDLVRRRPDGALDYLGRTDDQVKVRGFRIELGEVETALRTHPQVADAAVATHPGTGGTGGTRLVAHLVPTDPATGIDIPAVRTLLRDRLPEYMVPAAFTTIDTIPLSGNGKVDKQALPAPGVTREHLADTYVAPASPVERAVAQVWSHVLGIDRVGAHDNFFELGGDSMLSIQVVAKARGLGFALTPRMLFQHQTVAGIAAAVEAADLPLAPESTGECVLTPLNDGDPGTTVFCFPEGGGNITGYLPLAKALRGEMRLLGVEPSWRDTPDGVAWDVTRMAQSCRAAVERAAPDGPYLLAGWSFGGVLAMETARLLESDGRSVRLIVLDSTLPTTSHHKVIARHEVMIDQVLGWLRDPARAAEPSEVLPPDIADLLNRLGLPASLASIDTGDLRRHLTVMRGVGVAVRRYLPVPVASPVHLFQAERSGSPEPLDQVWRPFTPDLVAATTPGDHFSFLRHPLVRTFARDFGAAVREATGAPA